MENFDKLFTAKIASGNKQELEDWITEMDNTMRYTEVTQTESNAIKRRIRIVRDYIDFHCKFDVDSHTEHREP